MHITRESRQTRKRLWLSLWFVGFIWLFAVLGYPFGYINLPILGVVSVVCLFAAFWINTRLVAMGITRPIGHSRHCQYDLQGINSDKCPECGTAI